MRFSSGLAFLLLAVAACGGDDGPADPTLVPGGGARDPGIGDTIHVYAIDTDTDLPIVGATVMAGDQMGTTDATGLATLTGVSGPLTVAAKATGYATQVWVGVDSQNVTLNLDPVGTGTTEPPKAELAGTITGWDALPAPAAGHATLAFVTYTQDPDIGAEGNNLSPPANNSNICIKAPPPAPAQPCAWRINSRVGQVMAYAIIADVDQRGTPGDGSDDTFTITGYATSAVLTVAANTPQTGIQLTQLAAGSTTTVQPDLGTPPAALTNRIAVVGVDVGAAGVLRVPPFPNAPTGVVLPSLSAIAGSTYEFLALAGEPGDEDLAAQSIVRRRGLTSASSIAAGEWMLPPSALSSDRTTASFAPAAGAVVHVIEFDSSSGSGTDNRAMGILLLDGSTTVTLPVAFSPLPSGSLTYGVVAIEAPGFDPQAFVIDDLTDDVSRLSNETIRLP